MTLLQKIDELLLCDHVRLQRDDECYFLREYIAGGGYQAGETNQLIFNLKMALEKKGSFAWKYKGKAIAQCAKELRAALLPQWLQQATLVPMPPSKCATDLEYDDRMVQIARLVATSASSVRELLVQRASTVAVHSTTQTRDVQQLISNYAIVDSLCVPPPVCIGLIDDVITTGAHFRAARHVLAARFPNVPIVGLFVARRMLPKDELPEGLFKPA